MAKLKEYLEREDGILQYSYGRGDGHGRVSRMILWNQPGNDLTGMVGRCKKVAETMEHLLEGEVYHYHTKLMMKEAHTGGSFVWHQDYGYVGWSNAKMFLSICLIKFFSQTILRFLKIVFNSQDCVTYSYRKWN